MGRQLCLSARLRGQVVCSRREERRRISFRLRSHDIDKPGHATYFPKSFGYERRHWPLTADLHRVVKPRPSAGVARRTETCSTQRRNQSPEVLLVLAGQPKASNGIHHARIAKQDAVPSFKRRIELSRRVGRQHAKGTNLPEACRNFSTALGQLDQRQPSGDRLQSHKIRKGFRESLICKEFKGQRNDFGVFPSPFVEERLHDLELPNIANDLDHYACSWKADALPNALDEPFVGNFQRLVQNIGPRYAFKSSNQAAGAAPRDPATPSHDDDLPVAAAAFDSEGANMSLWNELYKSYTLYPSSEIQQLFNIVRNFLENVASDIDIILQNSEPCLPGAQDIAAKISKVQRIRERREALERRLGLVLLSALEVVARAGAKSTNDTLLPETYTALDEPVPSTCMGQSDRQQAAPEIAQERLAVQRDKDEARLNSTSWNQAIGREEEDTILKTIRAKARIPIRKVVGRESSMAYMAQPIPSPPEREDPEQTTTLSLPSDPVAEQLNDDTELAETPGIPRMASVGNAFKPSTPKQAALSTAVDQNPAEESEEEDVYVPLTYQIPEDKMTEALDASPTSNLAYWSYDKYRSPDGASISIHYCKKIETSEMVATLFLNQPIIGCDIEWKPSAKEVHGMKANVSLIQIASEDRIALFHIAVHKGDKPENVLAPTLKQILESSDVMKCGVAIGSDFTRMQKHLGIETNSIFELSHLHKLVEFGNTNPKLVNKKLVSLTSQAQSHLGLPLYKGEERVSDWSQSLNMKQCKYAADDAYASYRIFEALKEKWYKMDPRPPFPACAELGLPIQLAPQPVSESSESDDDSFVVNSSADEEEAGTLQKNLATLDIDDTASVDSYGENAFDSLTEKQLRKLETRVDNLPTSSLVEAMETDRFSDDTVRYPVLPLEYDEPQSFLIGRLGLQPRLRASSGRHGEISQGTSVETQLPDQPEEDLDTITEAKTNIQPIDNIHKELSVEATLWAQEMVQLKSATGSSKAKSNLTVAALRAYYLWEQKKLNVDKVAKVLRDPPLKKGTVAAYVAECVQFGEFEWADASRLKALVKAIPPQARVRYKRIMQVAAEAASE